MTITAETRKEIQELLKEIWSEFRRVGTTNEWEIVESIAERLITGQTEVMPANFRPRSSPNRYSLERDITPLLDRASALAEGRDVLFDRYILFYASLMSKKGDYLYPVPRHLVDFMLKLLQIKPKDSFADFTCGTGGFLVNRDGGKNLQQGLTLGIELSSEAARLAGANAILHGMTQEHTQLRLGDALKVCQPEDNWLSTDEEVRPRSFDYIAMAPPFGITIEASLATRWTNGESGRNSENIFTRLSLKMLKDKGWAALLVPTGLTYNERRGFPALRKLLLQQCTLRAVISLEQGMLEPFSNERTSILLFQNIPPIADQQPWFFRVEKDGYTSGTGRNLIMEPKRTPGDNDLPLVEEVLSPTGNSSFSAATKKSNETGLSIASISIRHGEYGNEEQHYGIIIESDEQTAIHSIRRFGSDLPSAGSSHLLITMRRANESPVYTIILLAAQRTDAGRVQEQAEAFTDRQKALNKLSNLLQTQNTPDMRQGLQIFKDGRPSQKLVIRYDGRLLGITQPRSVLEQGNWDLQPARYVPLPDEILDTRSPVTILSEIQQSQNLVTRYVDSLLGQLEVRAVVGEELPPRVHAVEDITMLRALGADQRKVWDVILKQTDTESHALYFTPEYIEEQLHPASDINETSSRIHVQQTLNLLERMGLVSRVLVAGQQGDRPFICYRRITTLDIADLQAESESI
jgi:hypothetical protein